VMGCVVNGPGEAAEADVAACCGRGKAAIFVRGRQMKTVPEAKIVASLARHIRALAKQKSARPAKADR